MKYNKNRHKLKPRKKNKKIKSILQTFQVLRFERRYVTNVFYDSNSFDG